MLNAAEAQARLNNLPAALTALNTVRNRSLASPGTQAYTATTLSTTKAMVDAILAERRIEFLAEGRRWADIHRLQGDDIAPIDGIPAKFANTTSITAAHYALGTPFTGPYGVAALPSTSLEAYKFVWPIPQVEIVKNTAIEQNEGWNK